MKTLLLNPPLFIPKQCGQKPFEAARDDILSIGYVGAYAVSRGHDVEVVDMFTWPWEKVADFIEKSHPEIIGIACSHSNDRNSAYDVAKFVKQFDRSIKVVFGGHHCSAMAKQIVRHLPVDAVVVGEGEVTFEELLRAWETNGAIHRVKGLVFMEGDEAIETEKRPPIMDLDILPFPIRGEIPKNRSVAAAFPLPLARLKYKGKLIGPRTCASLSTSRGCPFKCRFCSVTGFWGATWRMRSPQNVVDEIELLVKNHGVQHIHIFDDIFTITPRRVIEICQEIDRRGIEVTWNNMTRVDSVNEDLAYWMRKSGCVWTSFGIETGDDQVMKTIDKQINNEWVMKAFDIFRRQGIATVALLMVGNPGETRASIEETKKLMRKIRPNLIVTAKTMVMPATELYEQAKACRLIDDDFWLSDAPPPYYTVEHNDAQLDSWANELAYAANPFAWELLKVLMFGRNWFEDHTGIRITRNGLERNTDRK